MWKPYAAIGMTRAIFTAIALTALIIGAAGIDRWVNPTEEQIAAAKLQRLINGTD